MTRILLLSNGHGEDLSGSLLGQSLQDQGHDITALPLAGLGSAYGKAGIPLLGSSHEFSTGGIGYTSLRGRLTELLQGQILYLLRRLIRLLRSAPRFDLIVVVGDVIPVIAAWLSRRPVATYLVAYSSHYEGRLRLPWPCAALLRSRRFRAVFSRDQLTADDLSQQLRRPVQFVGNPFMDPVLTPAPALPAAPSRIGLLPGSRRPAGPAGGWMMLHAGRRRVASMHPPPPAFVSPPPAAGSARGRPSYIGPGLGLPMYLVRGLGRRRAQRYRRRPRPPQRPASAWQASLLASPPGRQSQRLAWRRRWA